MAQLTKSDYLKIIAKRDPAYDGRFYFGVKTTKIFCRPVCPAKPLAKNIVILKSCAEATSKGFRPCKRCTPDLFPGQRLLEPGYELVGQALSLFESGHDQSSLEEIAQELGITSRHLRRLFNEYLGAGPREVWQTHKLLVARKLLLETDTKIIDIAFAVGFGSLRRFNEAFKQAYQISPSEFRGDRSQLVQADDSVVLSQPLRSPYDWDYVIAYLERHQISGQEFVKEGRYYRYDRGVDGEIFNVSVAYEPLPGKLFYSFKGASLKTITQTIPKLECLFDLKAIPTQWPQNKFGSGIRIPGHIATFEVAVSIILSQLISTTQATRKLEQVVRRYGFAATASDGVEITFFPLPSVLKTAELESLGLPKVKASAIREVARQVDEGILDFHSANREETKNKILAIKGIGPWTAELISLRILGDVDAFPASDLAVAQYLAKNPTLPDKWSGYRGYLAHAIWRDYVRKKK